MRPPILVTHFIKSFRGNVHSKISRNHFISEKYNTVKSFKQHFPQKSSLVQGGAEPTDTFQIVIGNIWKQGKISETVLFIYYPQITSVFSEHQADDLRLHQCIVASVSGSCRTRDSVGPHQ